MAIAFNPDEVFEIARQMERNGAAFYRRAADNAADESHIILFQDLAEMEDSHERTFARMQEEMTAESKTPAAYDPDSEAARYLQAFVSGHVFDLSADPMRFFDQEVARDMVAVLRKAIELERDSVVFYLAMKGTVQPGHSEDSVGAIIEQEMSHIALLSEQLAAL
ncbi:MAG TPA: ferritin family protein [Candidatus Hydrogenedentes bacterium]|nr:ferritin family protein [Candidatus Hydrogenedentota bacterium]